MTSSTPYECAETSDLFPVDLALGPGELWVTNRAGPELVEVDPATDQVRRRIPNIDPSALVVYGGSVWLSDRSGSEVVRLNPTTLTRTQIPLGSPPYAIAPAGGALWVAAGRADIWKILPPSNSLEDSVPIGPARTESPAMTAPSGSREVVTSSLRRRSCESTRRRSRRPLSTQALAVEERRTSSRAAQGALSSARGGYGW